MIWFLLLVHILRREVGIDRDNNKEKQYESYRRIDCKSGDVEAQFDLASECWEKGDYEQAFLWCKKAAEQGDVTAQLNLGLMYKEGEGVLQDYEQSFYWYRKSAKQGNANAQNSLGIMYECGYGVKKNIKRAFDWYLKAKRNGSDRAEKALKNPIFDKIRIERLIK